MTFHTLTRMYGLPEHTKQLGPVHTTSREVRSARRWPRTGRALARHEARQLAHELPLVVEAIARSMRSGASLVQALREIEPSPLPHVAAGLAEVFDDVDTGSSLSGALEAWAERSPHREVRVVAAALAFAGQNEAGATRALDGLGHSLRDRAALESEVRALTAQAAASMQALVVLPTAFLLLDALLGQSTLRYLTEEPFGRLCLVAGLGLQLLGWFWSRRMIQARMP